MRTFVLRLAAALLAFAPSAYAAPADPGNYTIDTAHSSAHFRVTHVGASELVGRFDKVTGSIVIDADLAKSRAEATIDATGVYSGHAKRDEHLRNPDFLDTAKFPTMRFVSTGVTPKADGKFALTGDLEILGVKKPVTFDVRPVGAGKDPWGGYRAGFVATASIKRTDFGMTKLVGPAGDLVTIEVSIEAIKK